MNEYKALKQKQQKEINEFPMSFAFTNDSFDRMMKEWGLDPEGDTDKILSIGFGGYIRKEDEEALDEMFKRHARERKAAIDADKTGKGYIKDMFDFELANHEYGYTYDISDTLSSVGYTQEYIDANKQMRTGLKLALKRYSDC